MTPAPKRDFAAHALAQRIHHLNIAAQREIAEFLERRDYNGVHYREDRWKEEVLEACITHAERNKTADSIMLAEAREQLTEMLHIMPTRGFSVGLTVEDGEFIPGPWLIGLAQYVRQQQEWSKRTFGEGLRTKGITAHIVKELKEIRAKPRDLSEWIDVMILAFDGYWRHGGDPKELMDQLRAKQAKNFKREWPTPTSEDEPVEHVRPASIDSRADVVGGPQCRECYGILPSGHRQGCPIAAALDDAEPGALPLIDATVTIPRFASPSEDPLTCCICHKAPPSATFNLMRDITPPRMCDDCCPF